MHCSQVAFFTCNRFLYLLSRRRLVSDVGSLHMITENALFLTELRIQMCSIEFVERYEVLIQIRQRRWVWMRLYWGENNVWAFTSEEFICQIRTAQATKTKTLFAESSRSACWPVYMAHYFLHNKFTCNHWCIHFQLFLVFDLLVVRKSSILTTLELYPCSHLISKLKNKHVFAYTSNIKVIVL